MVRDCRGVLSFVDMKNKRGTKQDYENEEYIILFQIQIIIIYIKYNNAHYKKRHNNY